jgi:hypothetical protein
LSKYKYTSPLDRGFTQFKLSRKQHNEIFKNRPLKWFGKCEYYYKEKSILIHTFTRPIAVLINTLLFPMILVFIGLGNIKEAWRELIEMYNQKQLGSFVSEYVHSEKRINQIMDIINNKSN